MTKRAVVPKRAATMLSNQGTAEHFNLNALERKTAYGKVYLVSASKIATLKRRERERELRTQNVLL